MLTISMTEALGGKICFDLYKSLPYSEDRLSGVKLHNLNDVNKLVKLLLLSVQESGHPL